MKLALHTKTAVAYKLQILRKNRVIRETPFRPYLITDLALDAVAGGSWLDLFTVPVLGEAVSPLAVRRDSGSVTLTQAGNTLTASSSFFVPADVGRLFKWGTGLGGNELYITGYTDNQNVTVSTSATVSTPAAGTIWYVNASALITPITGLSFNKDTGSANNYFTTSTSGDTVTVVNHTTFVSSAFASNKTLTEIGFNTTGSNSNLYDRDLISPPVSVVTGDQARIILEVSTKYSPITPLTVANFATGYDSSGHLQIEGFAFGGYSAGIRYFDSNGNIQGMGYLEPGFGLGLWPAMSDWTPAAFNANSYVASSFSPTVHAGSLGYGSGNFYVDWKGIFSITQANGTIYGICVGAQDYGTTQCVSHKFNTPLTKLSTQTLDFTFRKSWSRVLTN